MAVAIKDNSFNLDIFNCKMSTKLNIGRICVFVHK